MPARRTARWAVPGAAALVLSCAALVGCGSSGGSSPSAASAPSSGGSSPSAGNASAHNGKLTGNFCTDFKNIGTNMPIPAADSGSLATLEQHDGRYLNQVSVYYSRLAAEAPPQAGQDIRRIASAYQDLASSIESGGGRGSTHSLSQIEQQIGSLTSSGAAAQAFKNLVIYVTTKCS
ncbi:MAG TPA: hypothetical protein VFJ07_01510 [Streptosporangiaceae bacterium]|nr:hypothetical protein [Streptosporangiaceae bacterium]